jgi:hypothetical protein
MFCYALDRYRPFWLIDRYACLRQVRTALYLCSNADLPAIAAPLWSRAANVEPIIGQVRTHAGWNATTWPVVLQMPSAPPGSMICRVLTDQVHAHSDFRGFVDEADAVPSKGTQDGFKAVRPETREPSLVAAD